MIERTDKYFEDKRKAIIKDDLERLIDNPSYHKKIILEIYETNEILKQKKIQIKRMRRVLKKLKRKRIENVIGDGGGDDYNNFIFSLLLEEENIMEDLAKNKFVKNESWFVICYEKYKERKRILGTIVKTKDVQMRIKETLLEKLAVSVATSDLRNDIESSGKKDEIEEKIMMVLIDGISKYEDLLERVSKLKIDLRNRREEYEEFGRKVIREEERKRYREGFFSDINELDKQERRNKKERRENNERREEDDDIQQHHQNRKEYHPLLAEKTILIKKINNVAYNKNQRIKTVSKYIEESREPKVFLLSKKTPDYIDELGNEFFLEAKHMPLRTGELSSLSKEIPKMFNNQLSGTKKFDINRTLGTSLYFEGCTNFYIRFKNKRARYFKGKVITLQPVTDKETRKNIKAKCRYYHRFKNRPIASISLFRIDENT